jgi:hypothetical protein
MRKSATEDGQPTAPALFLVDIRDIPADFARRPSAQQGASLYGFDQAIVIAAAFKGGAIEAFEFDHHPGLDIGIRRTDLIPSDDPFLSTVARFRAARDVLRPHATGSEPRAGTSADLLERANDALDLAVISAHECERIPLKNHIVATVFDAIQRLGSIRFRYLMIVENEDVKAILCAVTAEPMELEEPLRSLPAALLKQLKTGDELRLWVPGRSMAVDLGQWSSVREFADRALEVARSAMSA